ncbi:hypothetical protein BWZ46_08280 [Listeria monocytogenes]|nr:hypothetical protein [Listeria monocytogenes]
MDVHILVKLHDNFIRSDGCYFDFLIKIKSNYDKARIMPFSRNCFFMAFKAFQMIIVLVK